MKTIKGILAAGAILAAPLTPSFAIEGLQLTVQCPDVILGWPSQPGETFIVQWRPDLNAGTAWSTLTNSLPADWGSYWTTFTDRNRAPCPILDTNTVGGGDGGPPPLPGFAMSATSTPLASELMAVPADGSGGPAPLSIYPPGSDMTGFILIDPATGQQTSGAGYIIPVPAMSGPARNSPQPMDGDSGGSSTPDPGFYRVVRNGASLWALTNSTVLSGVVTLPVEVGNDGGTLETVALRANDSSIPGVDVLQPPFSLLWFAVDTSRLYNGYNYLVVNATWDMNTNTDPEVDEWPNFLELQSVPVQVVVSNEISFPNWVDGFGGNSCSFDVVSIYPEADWQIDIYNSQSNYVGSFTGHTTDGNIQVIWGVTNSQGAPLTDSVFYSATTVSDSTNPAKRAVRKPNPKKFLGVDNYPPVGQWIVAWQNIFEDNLEQYKNQAPPAINMLNSIGSAREAAQNCGGMIPPLPGLPGDFSGMRWSTNGTIVQKQQDWAQFKIALTNLNARNLYYFGHGAPDKLGRSDDPNQTLTSGEVGTLLHSSDSNPTNRHFFRYVFLDGCQTADGSFPTKFGIEKNPNVQVDTDFTNNGLRPRAFSGWSGIKLFSAADNIPWQFPGYRMSFWFYWSLANKTLSQAHEQSRLDNIGSGFAVGENLKIYGDWGLRFQDYNQ